jgi:hypothetical protein
MDVQRGSMGIKQMIVSMTNQEIKDIGLIEETRANTIENTRENTVKTTLIMSMIGKVI